MTKCKKIIFIFLITLLILGMSCTIFAATYQSKYPEPKITLKQGSKGDNVKWLQDMLKHNGYSISIDGIFGSDTRQAVISFQSAKKITVDGIVGNTTRKLLKENATNTTNNDDYDCLLYTNTTNVRIRASASTNSEVVTKIAIKGTRVYGATQTNIGKSNFWTKVKFGNYVGYIRNDLLSKNKPTVGSSIKGYDKTITVGEKTYKIYKQGKYKNYKFWGGTIASHGCGPTCVAIVASGYEINIDPVGVTKYMSYGSLDQVSKALNSLGIEHSNKKIVNNKEQAQNAITQIRKSLKAGKPVIVLVGKSNTGTNRSRYTGGGHFMVLLGEENGQLIIGQPSNKSETGTLENLVNNYMLHSIRRSRGYIIISE